MGDDNVIRLLVSFLIFRFIGTININANEDPCNKNRTLTLLHEQEIRSLLNYSLKYNEQETHSVDILDRFEASGVSMQPDGLMLFVIFDNTFQIGAFFTWSTNQTTDCTNRIIDWPNDTFNELISDFEGIAHNVLTDTYFLAQETSSSSTNPDEYNSNIFEIKITTNASHSSITLIESCQIMWVFDSTAKGFEGIEFINHEKSVKTYLLALCEANRCIRESMFKDRNTNLGHGRLVVLEKHEHSCQWQSVGVINLKTDLEFSDYSAMSIYPRKTLSYIAIASQENSQAWIGILEIDESPYFLITSSDKSGVYNLPRTIVNDSMCGKEYCNIEGVAWIDENHLVLVSDVRCRQVEFSTKIFFPNFLAWLDRAR
ncbi:unnamed protein product [Rotaria magnacalcarata]|uniref:Uncharacterized protein n=1 Tax=Rotaria magnacalcarata TaxID=392030 RepID=A0A8S3EH95_9BILA|nr:unnamed protein product [Rotaria magnacalcarata]